MEPTEKISRFRILGAKRKDRIRQLMLVAFLKDIFHDIPQGQPCLPTANHAALKQYLADRSGVPAKLSYRWNGHLGLLSVHFG